MRRALLVLALLALPACSGDGGDDAREAYVRDAGAVCAKADAEATALATPTTPAGIGPYVEQTLAIAKRVQSELGALTPPPDDEAELREKVLDPFDALVTEGEAYAAKVEAAGTDTAKLLPLVAEQPTAEGIDLEYLRSYGLASCADVIDTST